MEIEKKEADAEGTAVALGTTDADLDAAAEEQEPVSAPEGKVELTQEQKDQQERSRLGRRQAQRVDKLEQIIETQGRNFNEFLGRFEDYISRTQQATHAPQVVPVQEEDMDRPLTRREWEQLEAQRDRSRAEQQTGYQKSYQRTLNAFRTQNPDIHEEVVAEKMKNFNVIVTGNPELDAEFNYNRAMASILKKKAASVGRRVPVNGGDNQPTGLSGTNRAKPQDVPTIKLDPDAQELMNYLASKGKDSKYASEALDGEVPLNLMGKRK